MTSIPIDKNILLLVDPDPQKRKRAVESLGRSMNKGAIKPLINLLETEKNIEVRRAIVLSLSFLGGDDVLPVLLTILKNENDIEARRNAAGGLRFFGSQVNARDIYEFLLVEDDPSIRNVLSTTLIYLNDNTLLPTLLERYHKEKNFELRISLLEIIGSIDDPKAKELLIHSTDPDVHEDLRFAATRAIARSDDVTLIPTLYEIYTNDASTEIVEYARNTLEEYAAALGFGTIEELVRTYWKQTSEPSEE